MGKSIFEFADKFSYESPWEEDWVVVEKEEARKRQIETHNIKRIEGPFDDKGKLVKYVSRKHTYYYLVSLNYIPDIEDTKNIKWAVSYDDDKANKSFYLFSGGIVHNKKIKVNIQINKAKDKFKIYAYTGDLPTNSVSIEVYYKQAIVLFIGGAGDKTAYLGAGPTNIVLNEIRTPFDNYIAPKESYKSKYLGFEDAYKDKISTEIIPFIPNKEGTSINIVGHSLGGWNGAHLSEKLSNLGYNVDLLVTIDPVGNDVIVNAISDIYWEKPTPKSEYWINIYADSEDTEMDDIIANLGEQWIPSEDSVDIFHEVKFHHREAGMMFKDIIKAGISSSDFLLHFINLYLDAK